MKHKRTTTDLLFFGLFICFTANASDEMQRYDSARWDKIHQKPFIDKASNADCLECHQEILDRNVRQETQAGLKTIDTLAWYQTLDTYEGEQKTFHQRHLVTPLANELMDLKCNTCHQGNDLREESIIPPDEKNTSRTQRKHVSPNICLMCHGKMNVQVMGIPGSWEESGKLFNDDCLTCHTVFRTNRHNVNFLNAEAIEASAKINKDTCFGCHGGRSWFRISFPYPRNEWQGMPEKTPEWAKGRSTESNPRFLLDKK